MIRVVAHRGLRDTRAGVGHNRFDEIERAFLNGLDVEIDVWRYGVFLPLTHDAPVGPSDRYCMLDDAFALLCKSPDRFMWVNVKCCGLAGSIAALAERYHVESQIMTFDYSVPDIVDTLRNHPGLPVALRVSEHETFSRYGLLREDAKRAHLGLWYDRFHPGPETPAQFLNFRKGRSAGTPKRSMEILLRFAERGTIAYVSPEVHWSDAANGQFNYPGLIWEFSKLAFDVSLLTDKPALYDPRVTPLEAVEAP